MDDLIGEFITETSESLSTLDSELVSLEQNPNDKEIIGNIFRLVHTIKGTCGFLGLPRLEHVAHAGENILSRVRDGSLTVTPRCISLVLEALDAIKALIEYLGENGSEPEGDDIDLIARLNAYAEMGEDAPLSAAAAPVAKAPVEDAPATGSVADDADDDAPMVSAAMLAELEEAEAAPSAKPLLQAEDVPEAVAVKPAPLAKVPEKIKQEAIKKGLEAANSGNQDSNAALANQSIRVNLDVLENLMSMVGELVLTRNQLMQIVRNKEDNDFKGPLQRLSYITTELQEGVMKTRMQPIGNAWAKFPRLIRDLSLELNKKINLKMIGQETELDRQLLELIKDPLTHMVRNSCDHGLELPQERIDAGKPEIGTVTLSAYHEGGHIIVDIKDDGRGLNLEKIKAKALANGLATEEEMEMMSDQQINQFIFRAGFSTAEQVTSVSGRGVGMDVVRTNIEKIGGTVELESVYGKGSTFHIKIPLTLAIVSVLIVDSNHHKFAIPQINVLELVRAGATADNRIETINHTPVLRLRDKLLPLISLSQILGIDPGRDILQAKFVVVCKVGASDYGLVVDNIYDTEEIVVKPVSECLKSIPLYSGNTVLGDGSVIMILDPNGIAKTTSGDLDVARKDDEQGVGEVLSGDKLATFLLFRSGDHGAPKAVPLELVSRLEEISIDKIEYSDKTPVVQYRGDLMMLTTIDGMEMPKSGICEVIVFTYDNYTVGLVVNEILDIVSAEPTVKITTKDKSFLGTIVMNQKSTDVLDVGRLLSRVLDVDMGMKMPSVKKGANLLFVEDSMFFRNLTVPFLAAVGHHVTTASNGEEALELLERKQFDIIVTDIEMPKMDGYQLARATRQIASYANTPIIAFTSTANEKFQELIQKYGLNDFVLKTEREKLINAIARHLQLEEV